MEAIFSVIIGSWQVVGLDLGNLYGEGEPSPEREVQDFMVVLGRTVVGTTRSMIDLF